MSFTHSRRPLIYRALVALLALGLLVACGGDSADTAQGGSAPTATSAAAVGDVARGQKIFETGGCIGCHTTTDQKLVGPGLKGALDGKGPYGDKLPNGKPITDENVAEWIRVGGIGKIGQMPGFNTLTPQDMADLIAYLKTLK